MVGERFCRSQPHSQLEEENHTHGRNFSEFALGSLRRDAES